MLFNSYLFIFLFLPITFFIYFLLNYQRKFELAKLFLVLSSLFFYSWWNIIYLPLILISMCFNYTLGRLIGSDFRHRILSKKGLLTLGIVANIGLLGYFKYSDFFITNFNFIWKNEIALLHLALPLAISFFTFQQIAYLVDIYQNQKQENNLLNYAIFVTFFPQLIAGPIVHHKEMMPQFKDVQNKLMNYQNIVIGLFIFFMGLFKKVIIADTFSLWVSNGFNHTEVLTLLEAWVTSLSYTFQLYFDFSGYTDMAIGIALLFNIKLPTNFNSPYKAKNIQDFWQRWHITLSRFLKDYIYIPLGGNRKSTTSTYINLMLTFLIGGLWHGAGWTFVFWGFLHGLALTVHRIWKKIGFKLNSILGWVITFNFINISWIFFRANQFSDAVNILDAMFFGSIVLPDKLAGVFSFLSHSNISFGLWLEHIEGETVHTTFMLFLAFFVILFTKNSMEIKEHFSPNLKYFIFLVFLTSSLLFIEQASEFLYFNF